MKYEWTRWMVENVDKDLDMYTRRAIYTDPTRLQLI